MAGRRGQWLWMVAALATAVVPPFASAAQWGAQRSVPSSADSTLSSVKIGPGGTLAMAFEGALLSASRTVNGVWTTSSRGGFGVPGDRTEVSSGGTVAWFRMDATAGRVMYRTAVGTANVLDVGPSVSTDPTLTDVAIGDGDDAVAVWGTFNGPLRAASHQPGAAGWEAATTIDGPIAAGRVRVASADVGPGGAAAIVWIERDDTAGTAVVRAVRRPTRTGAWSAPVTVTTLSDPLNELNGLPVGVDAAGNAIAAWSLRTAPATATVQTARLDGTTGVWTVEAPVATSATTGTSSAFPTTATALAVAPDGGAIVGWSVGTPSRRSVVVATRATGQPWSTPVTVDPDVHWPDDASGSSLPVEMAPAVAIADGGHAVAAWLRRSVGLELTAMPQAAVFAPASGWTSAADLAFPFARDPLSFQRRVLAVRGAAIAPDGRAVVAWYDPTPSPNAASAGGATRFAEYAPGLSPATPPLVRFAGRLAGPAAGTVGANARLVVTLNRAVEAFPVTIEQRVGARWVPVRRMLVDGRRVVVTIRPTVAGLRAFRALLRDRGVTSVSSAITMRVRASTGVTMAACERPIDSAGTAVGEVWLVCAERTSHSLRRVSYRVGRSTPPLDVGPDAVGVALTSKNVWVAGVRSVRSIDRVTRSRGPVVALPIAIDEQAVDIAANENVVWVLVKPTFPQLSATNPQPDRLVAIDTASGVVERSTVIPRGISNGAFQVIAGNDHVDVVQDARDSDVELGVHLVRISDDGTAITPRPATYQHVAVGPAGLWGENGGAVVGIEPRRPPIPGVCCVHDMAVGRTRVWTFGFSPTGPQAVVRRISVATRRVVRTVRFRFANDQSIVEAGDTLWLMRRGAGTLTRID